MNKKHDIVLSIDAEKRVERAVAGVPKKKCQKR